MNTKLTWEKIIQNEDWEQFSSEIMNEKKILLTSSLNCLAGALHSRTTENSPELFACLSKSILPFSWENLFPSPHIQNVIGNSSIWSQLIVDEDWNGLSAVLKEKVYEIECTIAEPIRSVLESFDPVNLYRIINVLLTLIPPNQFDVQCLSNDTIYLKSKEGYELTHADEIQAKIEKQKQAEKDRKQKKEEHHQALNKITALPMHSVKNSDHFSKTTVRIPLENLNRKYPNKIKSVSQNDNVVTIWFLQDNKREAPVKVRFATKNNENKVIVNANFDSKEVFLY